MTVRSLNGLNGSTTNVVITNRMLTTEPLEMTQTLFTDPIVLSLKGITGFTGSGGNILKSNSANNALEWATETDTTYTGTAPIVITGTTISYDNTTSGTFTNKTFGDLTMFESSLSCRNSSSSGYIRLYTNGASSTNFVDLFTPNNLTQDHTIFLPSANGILALTTDLIQPNYGGTGKSSLSGETGKVLRVNSNENGYDFYTLPSPITQYWGLSGNVLSPTSSYDLQVAEIINIGSSTVYYQLKTDTTNNAFQLTETDGTTVLKYTSNGRLDFGYSILIGSNPAYPAGQGLPFGTTGTIYSSSIYSKIITTDDITLSEYGASPPTTQSYIRCNSSGNLTFSAGGEFTTGLKVGGAIAFDDLGTGATSISYIYDPRQNSGVPSTTNNAFNFHSNGTEVNLNCRVAAGGTSSAVNLKFAGSTLYRFNENLTMDVDSRSFSFPSSSGTLAKIGDIAGNSYISSVDTVFSVDGNGRLSLGVVGVVEGGTGQNSITNGDLLYGKPLNSMGKIAIGSTGQYLKVVSGIPGWVTETNTNFFSFSGNDIYLTNTADNLMLGMSSFFPAAKLGVQGNTWLAGQVTINESALLIGLYFSYLYDTTNGRGVISNPNSTYTNKNILTWADNDVGLCVPQSNGYVNFRFANVIKMTFGESLTKLTGELEITEFVLIGGSTQIGTNALSVYGDTNITGDITTTGTTFTAPRFKLSHSGSYLNISNPDGDNATAQGTYIQWHNNGTYLGLYTPVGGASSSYAIQCYIGTTEKLKITGLQTHSSQKMSIDGYFYMGYDINGATSTDNLYMLINHGSGSSDGATYIGFKWNNVYIGEVAQVGTSSVVYSTTSDYRLKDDIVDCDSMLDTIDKMNVKEYSFKGDKEENIDQKHIGFLAHEVQELDERFNTFVSGKKNEIAPYCNCCHSFNCNKGEACMECDEDGICKYPMIDKVKYQSIDYGKLTPICIKGIQELHTIIKEQQVELDTYKSIIDKLINSKSFVDFKKSIA